VIKKVSAIALAVGAGVLVLSTPALASDNDQSGDYNNQNNNYQMPIQACNNSGHEGVVGELLKHVSNSDKHNGKCEQSNSADN
jgi:uncharacterized low-complexity protein